MASWQIELIRADEINDAYERMLKGDVKYRLAVRVRRRS